MNFNLVFPICIFVIGLIGLIANLLVFYLSYKTKIFQSTIGLLIRNAAVFSSSLALIFIFYVSPAYLLGPSWQEDSISSIFGYFAILFHDTCLYTHVTISVNRCIAAFYPNSYSLVFTRNRTVLAIAALILMGALITAVHLSSPDCWLYFKFDSGYFTYKHTNCGDILRYKIQFPRNVVVIGVAGLIDAATFWKIRDLNKKRMLFSSSNNKDSKRRHNAENALIKQICIQSSMYILEFLTYFIISSIVHGEILQFIMTTVAWQSVHAVDAMIVILMNREMRNWFLCKNSSRNSVVSLTPNEGKPRTTTSRM